MSRRWPTPPPHLRFDEKRELPQSVQPIGDDCNDRDEHPYAVPSGVGGQSGGEHSGGGTCTFGQWGCDGLSLRLCGYVTTEDVGESHYRVCRSVSYHLSLDKYPTVWIAVCHNVFRKRALSISLRKCKYIQLQRFPDLASTRLNMVYYLSCRPRAQLPILWLHIETSLTESLLSGILL